VTEHQPVLIVLDDDIEIAEVIGNVGEQAGFGVKVTTNYSAFCDAVRSYDPNVIVLDLQMPEIDGIQVLRGLAEQEIQAGIVLVTGVDARTIEAAEQYGTSKGLRVLATFQKPFFPEDMLEMLRSAYAVSGPLTVEDLREAIQKDQLLVYYQPTVTRFADSTWDIGSVEALIRWNHPDRGMLAPEAFLEMSETSGLIGPMTDYVIQQGIDQVKGWQSNRLNLGLRVNISATLLTDIDFPDRLEVLIAEREVDPSLVTLEITETAMLEQHANTFDILTRLRVKDMNLSIDDFGIGYSSLTQLFRMPFNEMKIDKSLVLRVPESKEAKIMVEVLVELAHKLNLTVCAEGVESEEVLEFLDGIGCDSAQGFYISRPIAPKDVPAAIERWDLRQHQHSAQEDVSESDNQD